MPQGMLPPQMAGGLSPEAPAPAPGGPMGAPPGPPMGGGMAAPMAPPTQEGPNEEMMAIAQKLVEHAMQSLEPQDLQTIDEHMTPELAGVVSKMFPGVEPVLEQFLQNKNTGALAGEGMQIPESAVRSMGTDKIRGMISKAQENSGTSGGASVAPNVQTGTPQDPLAARPKLGAPNNPVGPVALS